MATISFNPQITTNAAGLFGVQSDGFVAGVAMDDPAVRFALAGGILAAAETLPMFGGIAISENIPTAANSISGVGPTIARATALANITGFSVFNQAYNGVITNSSNVPTVGSGQTVNFFRLGSGARIALAIDPALVTLDGGLTTQNVSWDYVNQKIITYDGTNKLPVRVLQVQTTGSKVPVYNSGTGQTNFAITGVACALVLL